MSELIYKDGAQPEEVGVGKAHIPHTPEELYGYFVERSAAEPEAFAGYADIAADAADSIDLTRRYGKTDEVQVVDIALMPGRSEGIHSDEQTTASKELLELIIFTHKLKVVGSEVTDENPLGRTLWQSEEEGRGVNLIETITRDDEGLITKLTAVSHIPDSLYAPEEGQKHYDSRTKRAIKLAKALQRVSTRELTLVDGETEEELDYMLFLQELPATEFESPYDQAA